jgi:hypothetical protein
MMLPLRLPLQPVKIWQQEYRPGCLQHADEDQKKKKKCCNKYKDSKPCKSCPKKH